EAAQDDPQSDRKERSSARGCDDGLNAKDNVGRVGALAAAPARGAGGLFRWDQSRHSACVWNGVSSGCLDPPESLSPAVAGSSDARAPVGYRLSSVTV